MFSLRLHKNFKQHFLFLAIDKILSAYLISELTCNMTYPLHLKILLTDRYCTTGCEKWYWALRIRKSDTTKFVDEGFDFLLR